MPREAEYANELPQSDNAIEQGQDAAHGAGGVELFYPPGPHTID